MTALIGALLVSLSADTANFEAGMRRAQRQTQSSATAINKSLGAIKAGIAGLVSGLSIGLFVNAIRSSLEYVSHLKELGETLGLTAKDLQTFSYAAGQVGISQEELQTGIQKLTISMGQAQLGAKKQTDAFKAIGISIDEIKGKDTGEVFRMIAEKLQAVGDRSQRAAVEVALFGKSGAKLDNLLSGAEGRLSDLSDAAERLGIVLSDEQIQKADETADKIAALQTVLKARIAGVVADNADSILTLANALATLIGTIGSAISGWQRFVAEVKAGAPALALGFGGLGLYGALADKAAASQKGSQAKTSTWAAIMGGTAKFGKASTPSGGVGKFLAPGGGSRKSRADHSAQDALRDANQFDQELRRAQMDVLQATQDLASDYVERTTIGIQILDAEKAAFDAEQRYETALFALTKGKEGLSDEQARQLKVEYDKTDALKRQALLDDEQVQRREEYNSLIQTDFDTQKDKLQSELQLATTAKQQRDIQLRLLDLSYRQERARLEAVIADEKASYSAKEDARRRLLALNQTYGNDRQGVIQNTQGPMEQFFSSVPKNADEAAEAMERLKVQGIDGAINSIVALSDGFESFRDTALSAIKQIIAELIRMQLMKLAMNLIGGASGGFDSAGFASTVAGNNAALGIPGFASGGSGVFGGLGGIDRNVLSLNGLPIAKVSKGEPFAIGHQLGMGGNPTTVNIHVSGNPTRETLNQIAARTRTAIASANKAGV